MPTVTKQGEGRRGEGEGEGGGEGGGGGRRRGGYSRPTCPLAVSGCGGTAVAPRWVGPVARQQRCCHSHLERMQGHCLCLEEGSRGEH